MRASNDCYHATAMLLVWVVEFLVFGGSYGSGDRLAGVWRDSGLEMKDVVDGVSEGLFETIKSNLPIEERMKETSSIFGSKVILFVVLLLEIGSIFLVVVVVVGGGVSRG